LSEIVPPDYWVDVKNILQLFFPQYFDPESPQYIDPILLDQILLISDEARPWCLSIGRQNFAQAMFTAYLITVQQETSSGQQLPSYAGPITSEKEGDIQIQYAAATNTSEAESRRPSSNPWDAWNRMWSICAKGAITTRFGDPCRSASEIKIMALQGLNSISKSSEVVV
jgi:hypothetical protein